MFTDKSKFCRLGSGGKSYVRRQPDKEYSSKYTKPNVKGGGGFIMVWGAVSGKGVGPIHRVKAIMDQQVYVNNILADVLVPYAEEYPTPDLVF